MYASPGDEPLEKTATQILFARVAGLRKAIQATLEEVGSAEGDGADDLREKGSELLVLFGCGASEEVEVLHASHRCYEDGYKERVLDRISQALFSCWVEDGIRTHDTWNHNPVL